MSAKFWKFELLNPDVVLTKGWVTNIISLQANVGQLLYRANEEKIIVITNINNPNNTPLFIGPTQNVSELNGYPIVAGQRITIGLFENTAIYGFAVANLNIYILDVGV